MGGNGLKKQQSPIPRKKSCSFEGSSTGKKIIFFADSGDSVILALKKQELFWDSINL